VELVFELFLVRAVATPELQQMHGGLGGAHAARLPLEQCGAQFVLQQPDLPRDHRRRRVEAFRRAADRAVRASTSRKYRSRC
jgi:hypothetical protein